MGGGGVEVYPKDGCNQSLGMKELCIKANPTAMKDPPSGVDKDVVNLHVVPRPVMWVRVLEPGTKRYSISSIL